MPVLWCGIYPTLYTHTTIFTILCTICTTTGSQRKLEDNMVVTAGECVLKFIFASWEVGSSFRSMRHFLAHSNTITLLFIVSVPCSNTLQLKDISYLYLCLLLRLNTLLKKFWRLSFFVWNFSCYWSAKFISWFFLNLIWNNCAATKSLCNVI